MPMMFGKVLGFFISLVLMAKSCHNIYMSLTSEFGFVSKNFHERYSCDNYFLLMKFLVSNYLSSVLCFFAQRKHELLA